MGRTLVAAPAAEPLSLSEAKLHLRVDVDADDLLITALIQAVRQWAEGVTNRALITQEWALTLPAFPGCSLIRLPLPALLAVSSIEYLDADGDEMILNAADYHVVTSLLPGAVHLADGKSWPSTATHPEAVTVTYTCGYGATAAAVPAAIRAAMLLQLGDLYANREAAIVGTIRTENPSAKNLLAPYRYVEAV